ncbi:hypothetical protein SAURM35S_06337 [Streptomyces aurantiogriseus]
MKGSLWLAWRQQRVLVCVGAAVLALAAAIAAYSPGMLDALRSGCMPASWRTGRNARTASRRYASAAPPWPSRQPRHSTSRQTSDGEVAAGAGLA